MGAEVTIPYQPIETMYRGYRFRSRLEARWAVFFTAAASDTIMSTKGSSFRAEGICRTSTSKGGAGF